MIASRKGKPLDRFPAIRSQNIGDIEHRLSSIYGARRFDLMGRKAELNVHANHWQSNSMAISYCHYGARVDVDFPEANFYRLQVSLEGHSQIRVGRSMHDIGTKSFCVVPPQSPLRICFRPGFEQLVLRIDAGVLRRKFSAITGTVVPAIEFESSAHSGGPAMARLKRLLHFFVAELDQQPELPGAEREELEQAIIVSFLHANPHRQAGALSGSPVHLSQRQLRLVEDYIAAHWNKPLSLEDLTQATGIGARSIFHYF